MDGTKPVELMKRCITLRREGREDDALALLRDALRRRQVPAESIDSAGRFLRKSLTERSTPNALKVLILGQCTTTWLVNALTAEAWGRAATAQVEEGAYDNVIQHLIALTESFDAIVLVPWHRRLLASDDRSTTRRVEDELAFLRQAWTLVQPRARLVQVGYDCMLPGPMGYHLDGRLGHTQQVRQANQAVREHLPEGAYFVDLEQISASIGHDAFYDARNYFWTKQPFSQRGLARFAEHLWAGIRAVTTRADRRAFTRLRARAGIALFSGKVRHVLSLLRELSVESLFNRPGVPRGKSPAVPGRPVRPPASAAHRAMRVDPLARRLGALLVVGEPIRERPAVPNVLGRPAVAQIALLFISRVNRWGQVLHLRPVRIIHRHALRCRCAPGPNEKLDRGCTGGRRSRSRRPSQSASITASARSGERPSRLMMSTLLST